MSELPPPQGPAVCPSCNAALPKLPQRKTKCRACGQFMYVRRAPGDSTRRLMTEAQMQAAEAQWRAVGQANQEAREFEMHGRPAADYVEAGLLPDLDAAIAKAHVLARGGPQTKMAVFGLYRAAQTPTDAMAAHLALIEIELQQARHLAVRAQLRCGPYDERQHCAPCERLRDTIVSTDAPIEAVAPLDCPKLAQPVGRLRGGCHVMVHVWIKRPDGTNYIDRRPTPERTGPPMTPEQIEQARKAWSGVLGLELPQAEPVSAVPASAPAPAVGPVEVAPAALPPVRVPWWRRLFGKG